MQLCEVTICVPKREHRVAVARRLHDLIALHTRILSVHVLQYVRMNLCVVESRVEHAALCLCAALHANAVERLVPCLTSSSTRLVKVKRRLFSLKVQSGIGSRHHRHTHLHLHHVAFFTVERPVAAHILSCHVACAVVIKFKLAAIMLPCLLCRSERRNLFPEAVACGLAAHTHNKIDREC